MSFRHLKEVIFFHSPQRGLNRRFKRSNLRLAFFSTFCLSLGFFTVNSSPTAPAEAPLAKAASDCFATKSLLEAAQRGQLNMVKKFTTPANIDSGNSNGVTPLMFATYYGFTPIVQFLLLNRANTNTPTTSNLDFNFGKLLSNRNNKTTALMIACCAGRLDIVLALLKAGTKVNAQDSDGQTALMYAILGDRDWPNKPLVENRRMIILALLEFGADSKIADNNGLNAIYYYSHVAGLVRSFGDLYEKNADLADEDSIYRMMTS